MIHSNIETKYFPHITVHSTHAVKILTQTNLNIGSRPEAMRDLRFSQASDVWSLAVVVVELFTDGKVPYSRLQDARQVTYYVEKGARIKQKEIKCSDLVYVVLLSCWDVNPRERPTFKKLVTLFEAFAKDASEDVIQWPSSADPRNLATRRSHAGVFTPGLDTVSRIGSWANARTNLDTGESIGSWAESAEYAGNFSPNVANTALGNGLHSRAVASDCVAYTPLAQAPIRERTVASEYAFQPEVHGSTQFTTQSFTFENERSSVSTVTRSVSEHSIAGHNDVLPVAQQKHTHSVAGVFRRPTVRRQSRDNASRVPTPIFLRNDAKWEDKGALDAHHRHSLPMQQATRAGPQRGSLTPACDNTKPALDFVSPPPRRFRQDRAGASPRARAHVVLDGSAAIDTIAAPRRFPSTPSLAAYTETSFAASSGIGLNEDGYTHDGDTYAARSTSNVTGHSCV